MDWRLKLIIAIWGAIILPIWAWLIVSCHQIPLLGIGQACR